MNTSSWLIVPVAALLLPIAHAAGGAGGGHGFWENFLSPPPLHPILVNFTAALIPVSFLSDLLGRWLKRESLLSAGWWTLLFGAVATPLTALAGWLWLSDMGDVEHREMLVHQWLGTGLALLFLLVAYWRWRFHRAAAPPSARYLAVSAVLVAALAVQGHLGGMMSFGTGEGGPKPGEHSQAESGHDHGQSLGATQPAEKDGVQWRPHIDLKD